MRIRNFTLVLSVIIVAFLSSCSKEKFENKIIGTWSQVSVGQIPEGTEYVWSFEDDEKLYISTYQNQNLVKVDTAGWDLEMRFARKNYLNIKDLGYQNGKYLIVESGDYLKIQRVELEGGHSGAVYLWMEFTKK